MMILKLPQFLGPRAGRNISPEVRKTRHLGRQKLMLLSLAGQQGPTLAGAIFSHGLDLNPGEDSRDFDSLAA